MKISQEENGLIKATVIGGSFLGSMIGFSSLKSASLLKEPVRMMYNENPYGPSDVAKEQCAEHSRIKSLYHASSFIRI